MALRAANRVIAFGGGKSVREIMKAIRDLVFDQASLVYIAAITQSSTDAPVATVKKNDLSGAIAWSYVGAGSYLGTLTGAFLAGTVINAGAMIDTDAEDSYEIKRASDDTITLKTGRAGTLTNGLLTGVVIKIEVLNANMTAAS